MIYYSEKDFETDIELLANNVNSNKYDSIYPVPRGGIPVAIALSAKLNLPITTNPKEQTLIVDDLVDSGNTRGRFPDNDFACLHIKLHSPVPEYFVSVQDGWIEYWWEKMVDEKPAEDAIIRIIESIGEDPTREGLLETPKRVIKSYEEIFSGYKQDPKDVFKIFEEDKIGGLVYLKNIEFYSVCEHHMLSFSGQAFVAYIPNGPVIGASKLARLLDVFCNRLQIQERIGEQVTNALMEYLKPIGAACLTEAKHLCMACRGVKKQHSVMGYSSLKGVFMEDTNKGMMARNELMALWARKGL